MIDKKIKRNVKSDREFKMVYGDTLHLIEQSEINQLLPHERVVRFKYTLERCETIEELKHLTVRINRIRYQISRRTDKLSEVALLDDLKLIHKELLSISGEQGTLDMYDSKRAVRIAGYLYKVIELIETGRRMPNQWEPYL